MFIYVLRRITYLIPILVGVSILTFILFNLVPGNPALLKAGKYATIEDVKRIEHDLGLDRPLVEQYLFFAKQIVTMDFGKSWATDQSIRKLFFEGLPVTLALATPAFLGSLVLSVALALFIALFHGRFIDRFVLGVCIFTMSVSVLTFIISFQYLFAYKFGWFPIHGFEKGWGGLRYILLPLIIWIALTVGPGIRLYRTVILEEIYRDYVRTAYAKGLSTAPVLIKHVLKNAMIPIITNEIIAIPFLITGSFLLENFFGLPGIGDMLINAISQNDFPVIKANVIIISVLFVIFQMLSDVLYSVVDPRVRLR